MGNFGAERFSIDFNALHKLPNALSRGAVCSVRSTPLALGSFESRQANRRAESNQKTGRWDERSTRKKPPSQFRSVTVTQTCHTLTKAS